MSVKKLCIQKTSTVFNIAKIVLPARNTQSSCVFASKLWVTFPRQEISIDNKSTIAKGCLKLNPTENVANYKMSNEFPQPLFSGVAQKLWMHALKDR